MKSAVGIARITVMVGAMVFGAAFPMNGHAEFYAGASLAAADSDVERADTTDVGLLLSDLGLSGTISVGGVRTDETDTGFKLFGGYNFNENFGLEVFYADFGDISQDITADIDVTDGVNTLAGNLALGAELETDGIGVSLLGRYPFSDAFNIFGKLGVFTYQVDADITFAFDGTENGIPATLTISETDDDDSSGYAVGIGGEYRFGNALGLRLEWERYDIEAFDTDIDTDVFSGSVFFRF